MGLEAWVAARGGIVRSREARRAGWSGRALTAAVADGRLQRPRQGWLALPSADPHLIAAARAGVVLTCVTQAARLGLWVLEEDRSHVAAPPHSGTVRVENGADGTRKATVHWGKPIVPRHPDVLVDPIENVLAAVAVCRPFEEALAIWESALNKGMVDALVLKRLPFTGRARELVAAATPYSDSGLESFVLPRLRWMNLRIVAQAWIAGRPVDFLIGERLVLQIDGGHHVGAQRESDIAHDALLMLMGYHVIRVGYRQMVDDWPGVQALIMGAVAEGLHRGA